MTTREADSARSVCSCSSTPTADGAEEARLDAQLKQARRQRQAAEKDARKRAKALLKSLKPGQKLSGRVTQVRDFGIFVDLGGVEGLAHGVVAKRDRRHGLGAG